VEAPRTNGQDNCAVNLPSERCLAPDCPHKVVAWAAPYCSSACRERHGEVLLRAKKRHPRIEASVRRDWPKCGSVAIAARRAHCSIAEAAVICRTIQMERERASR
jgi:hypothetical protein